MFVVTCVMSAREMTNFLLELVDGKSRFDRLVMDNWTISDVFVDVLGRVNDRRLDSLTLDHRLNCLVDVVMSEMMSVGAAINLGALGWQDFSVIGDACVHFLETGSVFIGHVLFVMTMFCLKLLVPVLGRERL